MNRKSFKTWAIVFIIFSAVTFTSCQKKTELPVVTTVAVSSITTSGAIAGGNVTNDGGADVTARGVCWTIGENPEVKNNKTTDGSGTGVFVSNIINLDSRKRYYVRAYATNSAGTAYGNQVRFVTLSNSNVNYKQGVSFDTIYDIEGNAYRTITISRRKSGKVTSVLTDDISLGDHWMAENLKVTLFNDGTPIPYQTDNNLWKNLTTPAYCYYFNTPGYQDTYGVLYNWYASHSGKLCPDGWHVAKYQDWVNLIEAVGGEDIAGGELKETGFLHWISPNTGATNDWGFNGLPGGFRESNGLFYQMGKVGAWWAESESTDAWHFWLHNESAGTNITATQKVEGYSVRCVKD